MVELTASDLALLTGPNYATFVTMNPDGSPHATITWVDAADGQVVNTAEGASNTGIAWPTPTWRSRS